jgi:hypothetical protein
VITVAGAAAAPVTRLRLEGNLEPEAFSRDRSRLFVLEYLPPLEPDRYRVRVYDLRQGTLSPLNTRDKKPVPPDAEETMRGQGRQAVLSPDHRRLYTLYTHQPDHLHTRDLLAARPSAGGRDVHAFVHCLDLDEGWAYCLDLPEPFGLGPAAGHTLALSPYGGQMFVYDATSGALATAGTESLQVTATGTVERFGGAEAHSAAGTALLYLAAGPAVQVVGAADLSARTWALPGPALGVALRGGDLYAGVAGRVLRLDAHTGVELGGFALPGLRRIRHAR